MVPSLHMTITQWQNFLQDPRSSLYKTFFQLKSIDIFLFLHENVCCGYSLEVEVPHQGTSNEYHNICFCGEIAKYTGDPIHRGPLFRDIQYIANRPWTPNLPWP